MSTENPEKNLLEEFFEESSLYTLEEEEPGVVEPVDEIPRSELDPESDLFTYEAVRILERDGSKSWDNMVQELSNFYRDVTDEEERDNKHHPRSIVRIGKVLDNKFPRVFGIDYDSERMTYKNLHG